MAARILRLDTLYSGWNRLQMVEAETARGSRLSRTVEDHGRAACVLPYDPERRMAMLVRQLRLPMLLAHGLQETLEAPAGIVDSGDDEACARREVMEEAGLRITALEPVATIQTMPGVSTELIALYLAPYSAADRVAGGGGLDTETEEIDLVEMPLAELAAMADSGRLADLKTLALVQTLRLRRPDLFGERAP